MGCLSILKAKHRSVKLERNPCTGTMMVTNQYICVESGEDKALYLNNNYKFWSEDQRIFSWQSNYALHNWISSKKINDFFWSMNGRALAVYLNKQDIDGLFASIISGEFKYEYNRFYEGQTIEKLLENDLKFIKKAYDELDKGSVMYYIAQIK